MKYLPISLFATILSPVNGERTFTDSRGKVVTTPDGSKPKIVINANGALSLCHLGLTADQLTAVYDHWAVRGSDLDTANIDVSSNNYDSSFALDPNQQEIEFLKQVTNLSPECLGEGNQGCFNSFQSSDLEGLDFDFLVAQRASTPSLADIEAFLPEGKQLIWIDDKHEQGCEVDEKFEITDLSSCHAASLIDIVIRLEEFSDFLGIQPTAKVASEKKAMCDSAANFVAHTESLHQKGIYAVAASLRTFNGGTLNWFPATSYPWLRTLEELGMPLLYPPAPETPGSVQTIILSDWFQEDGTTPAYPVDYWLFDSRTYGALLTIFEDVAAMWPDPSFRSRQYSPFLFNDGAISYTNVRRFLDELREQTAGIARIHQDVIECVDVDVTSREYINRVSGGAGGGKFACYGNLQSLYTECPADAPLTAPPASTNPTASTPTSSVTGISPFISLAGGMMVWISVCSDVLGLY